MSYENETRALASEQQEIPGKLHISTLRYLWESGPFSLKREENIPKFLARQSLLQHFSDNELRILAQSMHRRSFQAGELVFRQGDPGYGLYFVFQGLVLLTHDSQADGEMAHQHVTRIERGQYFGEMGLLEEYNRRSVSAVCDQPTTLLGLFKPDLEALLDQHPIVGAKLMREVAVILAQRMNGLAAEVTKLRQRLDAKAQP